MPQYLPVLREVPADHVDPSLQERPVASDRPNAEAKEVIDGLDLTETDAAADRAGCICGVSSTLRRGGTLG